MKELVVLSGKGGTGKTSIVASFSVLAKDVVTADCDVDAPDLNIIFDATNEMEDNFYGMKKARIMPGHCIACGKCEEICRYGAIYFDGPGNGRYPKTYRVEPLNCEGCGLCAYFCAENAIEFKENLSGKLYFGKSRLGNLVHARLFAGEENSGKLVAKVRERAKAVAERENIPLIITDAPPGVGCPVISSITGADYALIVAEPTLSGLHDCERVHQLLNSFGVPSGVVVNKADIAPKISRKIEDWAKDNEVTFFGELPYDPDVTLAQIEKKAVVEYKDTEVAEEIKKLWEKLRQIL